MFLRKCTHSMYGWICMTVSSECWCFISFLSIFDVLQHPQARILNLFIRFIYSSNLFHFRWFRAAWRIQFYSMDRIRRRWRAQNIVYHMPIWWRWFVSTLRHSLFYLWGERLTIHNFTDKLILFRFLCLMWIAWPIHIELVSLRRRAASLCQHTNYFVRGTSAYRMIKQPKWVNSVFTTNWN